MRTQFSLSELSSVLRPIEYSELTPDERLMTLASEGAPFERRRIRRTMAALVEGMKQGIPRVYFPFYWSHADLQYFYTRYNAALSIDDVLRYYIKIRQLTQNRSLTWIERINLFHVYGLLRVYGKGNETVSSLIRADLGSYRVEQRYTLVDLSATNALAVARGMDLGGITLFIESLLQKSAPLQLYGRYQILYFGGVDRCISRLSDDFGKASEVAIPSSILGLMLEASTFEKATRENTIAKIMDRLFTPLPTGSKDQLERYINVIGRGQKK